MSGPRRQPHNDHADGSPPDWNTPADHRQARQAIHRLLVELGVEKASPLEVAQTVTREVFAAEHLGAMLRRLYQNDPYRAVTDVVPALQSWRHAPVPDAYWQGTESTHRAEAATRRMLAELAVSTRDPTYVVGHISPAVFEWCNLAGMLRIVYAGSPTSALRPIVAGIPHWRHERGPRGTWQGLPGVERAQDATRRLIGEHGWGGLSAPEIGQRVSRQLFLAHGLSGMLDAVYARQGYAALADLYPDLRPWQMAMGPAGYWQGRSGRQHARTATHWLITRLQLTSAPLREIAQRLDKAAFLAHGLGGMLSGVYHNSTFAALHDIFPALRPWLVDITAPHGYWDGTEGRERAHEAMRWLIAQLDLEGRDPVTIAQAVDRTTVVRMHLGGMLTSAYANSLTTALMDIYPNLQPWQMRNGVPNGYWTGAEGREHARAATRWVLVRYGLAEEDPTDLVAVLDTAVFAELGLYGMLSAVYHQSSYAALADIFPQLPPWEARPHRPQGYWQGKEGRERARGLVRRMLGRLGLGQADAATVAEQINKSVFAEHGLSSLLRTVYGGSTYAALHDLFPELRPWQMGSRAPQDCWSGPDSQQNAREATRHMLVRLGLADTDRTLIAQVVDAQVFDQAGLGTMLALVYAGSPYQALQDQYPDLQPWQMARTPRSYWQGPDAQAHGREATRWLLNKLGIAPVPGQHRLNTITKATFEEHGLGGMLNSVYANSPGAALADAIPGLPPWGAHSVPRAYWQGAEAQERARTATRWLLGEQGLAGAEPTALAQAVNRKLFVAAGLGGMLARVYGGSIYAALADVVAGLLPWQMGSQVPLNYWQGETGRAHAREALRWLLAQLGLQEATPLQIGTAITHQVFIRFGLHGMLTTVYGSSRFAALADVVPELRPWQMGASVPQGYWQGPVAQTRGQEAMHWLLAQIGLQSADAVQVAQALDVGLFRRYGLAGMLHEVYSGSLFWALRAC